MCIWHDSDINVNVISEKVQFKTIFENGLPFLSSTFDKILNKSICYAIGKDRILKTLFLIKGRFEPSQYQIIGEVVEKLMECQIISIDDNYFMLDFDVVTTCYTEQCPSYGSQTLSRA